MSEKFQNKYRIPSSRWQQWDYRSEGIYFITICTKNRIHYFGEIENGQMNLNELGGIVNREWVKTIELRADMNLEMGEFIVMPNHFHAVIRIGKNKYNENIGWDVTGCGDRDDCRNGDGCVDACGDGDGCADGCGDADGRDAMHCVSTLKRHANTSNHPKNQFGVQSKNLASIIRGFKSAVTTYSKKHDFSCFEWQARYHDHVIRNPYSFERIQNYIINNPRNWKEDTFNK